MTPPMTPHVEQHCTAGDAVRDVVTKQNLLLVVTLAGEMVRVTDHAD